MSRGPGPSPLFRPVRGLIAWAVAVVLLTPVYWLIVTVVSPTSKILSRNPRLVPPINDIDLSAFVRIFSERPALYWLANSAMVTVTAIVVTLLVSLPAGYAISRATGIIRDLVGYLLLVSLVLPSTLIIIPIFVFYSQLNLIDNPIAVGFAVASTTAPFSIWMMKTYFDSIPRELEEAATVDGATGLQTFNLIILPVSGPGVGAVLAFTSIWAWSDFLYSSTLLLDDGKWTLTVGVVTFIGEYAADWQGLMATGLVATVPLVILFVLLQRLLVEGLTGGAVKD
jgi:multiple sugar transport system permease protein